MKEIKTKITNTELDVILLSDIDLIDYIKEHPNTLESNITHLTDNEKKELIIHFSKLGHIKYIKCLVEQTNNTYINHEKALRMASAYGHLDVVKYFVEKKANIHAEFELALRWAAENGHLNIVKYLVEHGANIHAEHNEALRFSAKEGHLDVVEYLIEQGANIHGE